MKVTTDDLLDAIRDALTASPSGDAVTVTEMCAATGFHEKRVRAMLRAVAQDGRLEVVPVRRVALDGRQAQVPGYRLKKAKRAA